MTCIVGMVSGGKVYIAGDSAGVCGEDLQSRKDSKVFRTGPYIMGFTSSFRMGQVLRYSFNPPNPPRSECELHRFMVNDFVESLREAFKKAGCASGEGGTERGGTFLVGVHGRLFIVDADYQVGESRFPYNAVGSGAQVALGAMFATNKGHMPYVQLDMALEAAEAFCTGVRAPFSHVETME